jgi:hypothetical protein
VSWLLRPFRWFVNFFGMVGTIALVGLIAAACAFFWAWEHEEWKAFVSAMAGGLAALSASLTRLLKDDEVAAKWVLTIGAVAFSAAFSWYTTTNLTNEVAKQTQIAQLAEVRLQLMKDDLISYVRPLPQDETNRILTEAGARLRARFNDTIGRKPPYREPDFGTSKDLLEIIAKLDAKSGHVSYISGEIERLLGGPSKGRQRFYEYLENEQGRTRAGRVGAGECRNPEGFCRERTAWIFHLLANDFYQHGRQLRRAGRAEHEYKAVFDTALKHACSAIAFFPANGFSDALQLTATRSLERLLSEELGNDCRTITP